MSPSRLRTVRDHIRWAVSRFHEAGLFFGHGTDNAWDDARQLVLGALHLPFEIADGYLDCRLEEDEQQHLLELIRRRVEERVPTAYLLGEAWFCGLPFVVDERVLVPRSPIAELIGQQFEPWLPRPPVLTQRKAGAAQSGSAGGGGSRGSSRARTLSARTRKASRGSTGAPAGAADRADFLAAAVTRAMVSGVLSNGIGLVGPAGTAFSTGVYFTNATP